MNLDEVKSVHWNTQPTPVEIIGTTFGNELQTRILTALRISNLFLFYLCVFATARYFMAGN